MAGKPTAPKVDCPTCGNPVPWTDESRWRPFCSHRCKLIDLGDWLDERHRIPGDDEPGRPPAGETPH